MLPFLLAITYFSHNVILFFVIKKCFFGSQHYFVLGQIWDMLWYVEMGINNFYKSYWVFPSSLCITGELWMSHFFWHRDIKVTHWQPSELSFIITQYFFSVNNSDTASESVNDSLPPKCFNCSNSMMVRAEPFTEVPEYGQLNVHQGVHKEGVIKISFTLHRLLANICL